MTNEEEIIYLKKSIELADRDREHIWERLKKHIELIENLFELVKTKGGDDDIQARTDK